MKSVTFSLQNMRCNGCKNSITSALNKIDGLSNLEVNPDKDLVQFSYTDDKLVETAISTLTKMGYPQQGESNDLKNKANSLRHCLIGKIS